MGVHYTPPFLADFIADRLIGVTQHSKRHSVRILDPSCGDGALLVALLNALQGGGMAQNCEAIGVEADASVLPSTETRLARFNDIRFRLILANFLELAADCREQAELWEAPSPHPALEHGFDFVIANPPYVRTQILGSQKAQQLAARYGLRGRVDLYHAFLVAATETLRPGGFMGIITSNRFLSTMGGSTIRGYLARNYDIKEIIDLGDTKFFEAAVLPAIFIGRRRERKALRGNQRKARFIKIYSQAHQEHHGLDEMRPADEIMEIVKQGKPGLYRTPHGVFKLTSGDLVIGQDPTQVWSLTNTEEAEWVRRVGDAARGVFQDLAEVRVGIKTTADEVFIRSDWQTLPPEVRPEHELLHPLLRHENTRRWSISRTAQLAARILYPHEVVGGRRKPVDLDRYPRAKAYLELSRKRLEKRRYVLDAGRRWYEIWVPQNPDAWSHPKIVFPDISPEPRFYLELNGRLVNGDCYWITLRPGVSPDMIYLLLAVANSSLMVRFHDLRFNNKLYSGRRRYITQYVAKYPYPDPALPASQKLIALAKQIVRETKRKNHSGDHPLHDEVNLLVKAAFGVNLRMD